MKTVTGWMVVGALCSAVGCSTGHGSSPAAAQPAVAPAQADGPEEQSAGAPEEPLVGRALPVDIARVIAPHESFAVTIHVSNGAEVQVSHTSSSPLEWAIFTTEADARRTYEHGVGSAGSGLHVGSAEGDYGVEWANRGDTEVHANLSLRGFKGEVRIIAATGE
jgi:hypothetical protein